ncbi:MAG: hypothetical protein EXR76_19355 [Myxococcales bacterium]|nr:hypothetical protein [Myxococcales bacterium]
MKLNTPSWPTLIYLGFGTLLLTGYGYTVFTGREPFEDERDRVPSEARASGHGYRSHGYWITGYHGGK